MSKNNACKETFLEDLASISVYSQSQCFIPVPFNLSFVRSVRATFTGTPLLKVSYQDDETVRAKERSITAKYSSAIGQSGRIYTMDIGATIEQGFDTVEVAVNTDHSNCVAVLEKVDGTRLFVHTLPNTFNINAPLNIGNDQTMVLTMKVQAVSPYIEVLE